MAVHKARYKHNGDGGITPTRGGNNDDSFSFEMGNGNNRGN